MRLIKTLASIFKVAFVFGMPIGAFVAMVSGAHPVVYLFILFVWWSDLSASSRATEMETVFKKHSSTLLQRRAALRDAYGLAKPEWTEELNHFVFNTFSEFDSWKRKEGFSGSDQTKLDNCIRAKRIALEKMIEREAASCD